MTRILVVNVNWLGDVVFSLPVFKALKEVYPTSKISCLAPPRVKEILESSPYVDQVILYDEQGQHRNFFGKLKLIAQLRQEKFDIAFLLHRSLTRALLVFLAGIPQRVGYDSKKRGFLLTHKVGSYSKASQSLSFPNALVGNQDEAILRPPIKIFGGDNSTHRSDFYLNVIESFGIKVHDRSCELQVNDQSRKRIDSLLESYGVTLNDFLVVVNAGGNWELKRWPKENFVVLINRLTKELDAKVVLPGAKDDEDLARWIFSQTESKPLLLAGQLTIKDLLALMKRATLVISADSGPLHLASGVGTTVIGLFGPTRGEVTGPRGRARSSVIQKDVGCNREPCYYLECPDNVCMKEITVDDVIKEIRQIRNS